METSTVARQVRAYVEARPVIRDALSMGIVNFSALARRIRDETGLDQDDAVVAACRRIRTELEGERYGPAVRKALAESRLEVRTNVGLLSYEPSWPLVEKLAKRMHALRAGTERVHLLHGWEALTIVADMKLLEDLRTSLGRDEHPLDERSDLAELNLQSTETLDGLPGFIAAVANLLSERNVNLVDAASCRRDHIFLIEQRHLATAIAAVQALTQE